MLETCARKKSLLHIIGVITIFFLVIVSITRHLSEFIGSLVVSAASEERTCSRYSYADKYLFHEKTQNG